MLYKASVIFNWNILITIYLYEDPLDYRSPNDI